MRRDLVVQVILDYGEFWESFATPYEAECFLSSNADEFDVPLAAWLEDLRGNKKWDFDVIDDGSGVFRLVERALKTRSRLIRNPSN